MNNNNCNFEHLDNDMLPEYDFTGGIIRKHYQQYRQGHTVTIHQADGTTRRASVSVPSNIAEGYGKGILVSTIQKLKS